MARCIERPIITDWLRLYQVAKRLSAAGYSVSEIAEGISKARLTHADIGSGPLLRFPERPPIPRSFIATNRAWLIRPIVDIEASTIVAPLRPAGTWHELSSYPPVMRPVVVEMSASDFDRLWPCGKRSKTGPKTNKLEQTIAAMRDRYEDNRRKLEGLIGKQMEAEFKVSRKTCAKARELLMVEWSAK